MTICYSENGPSWTVRKLILQSGHIGFFSKGLSHDFGQKLENSSWFVFGQSRPRKLIMFDDHLFRKQALLDYKKLILSSGHTGFSSAKGLTLG